MRRRFALFTTALAVIATGCIAAGCTVAGSSPVPSAVSTPTPTSSLVPETSPGPSASAVPVPAFTLRVLPAEEPIEARVAIPGEKVSFLITVADDAAAGGSGGPVTVAATATGARVTDISPAQLAAGTVGEVWLVPDPTEVETTAQVSFTATRGDITRTDTRSIKVWPMKDERASDAQPYFERWVAWLASAHPELGITATTKWDATFVSTFLVVSHYAYYSDEWEMKISWHNMIPPYDWSEVYLRHRGVDAAPSLAFRIDSVSAGTQPHAVAPPDAIMR